MTLSGQTVMSAAEFNHYDTMSSNAVLMPNQMYQYRSNIVAMPTMAQQESCLQEQQQETSVLQQPPLLRSQLQLNAALQNQQQQPEIAQTRPIRSLQLSSTPCTPISTAPTVATTNSNTQTVPTISASIFSSHDLGVENVMPGIYLTKNFIAWNEENLRSHGFTHIIIIDKHIKELYYPSPVFKLSKADNAAMVVDAFDAFDDDIQHITKPSKLGMGCASTLKFGKEFEAIDLNFGEKSYLTTVLPNCYRAVKFINKALQCDGTILVIDCNGGEQKCITIIVAYLMYKHNIKFSNAFARLREYYKKADLDRFYMTQLYEYEPILQVQRAQSCGHSCSRERHAAILKRKKTVDDVVGDGSRSSGGLGVEVEVGREDLSYCMKNNNDMENMITLSAENAEKTTMSTSDSDFFNNFNPLSNFHKTLTMPATAQATNNNIEQLQQRQRRQHHHQQQSSSNIYHHYRNSYQSSDNFRGGEVVDDYCLSWDDNAME